MKITEIIGILGFFLALTTFVLTRLERRKKLTIDLYFKSLQDIDIKREFISDEDDDICYEQMLVIEIINHGNRSVLLDSSTLKIILNNRIIQNDLDWLGKMHYENPLNPGQNHKFAVFLNSLNSIANVKEELYKNYPIKAEINDLENTKYRTKRKFELISAVGEVVKK